MDVATFVATLIGALSTAGLGIVAFSLSRQAQYYAVQRAIGDLQTAVARFRSEHPEVMSMSQRWSKEISAQLYAPVGNDVDAQITRYYCYVELGLEFCNTTLAAAVAGRLSSQVFEWHYRPLVRHFIAENYPFVAFAVRGPYLSRYVRNELTSAELEGWHWAEKHTSLCAKED